MRGRNLPHSQARQVRDFRIWREAIFSCCESGLLGPAYPVYLKKLVMRRASEAWTGRSTRQPARGPALPILSVNQTCLSTRYRFVHSMNHSWGRHRYAAYRHAGTRASAGRWMSVLHLLYGCLTNVRPLQDERKTAVNGKTDDDFVESAHFAAIKLIFIPIQSPATLRPGCLPKTPPTPAALAIATPRVGEELLRVWAYA